MGRQAAPTIGILAAVAVSLVLVAGITSLGPTGPMQGELALVSGVVTGNSSSTERPAPEGYPCLTQSWRRGPTASATPAPTPDATGYYPEPEGVCYEITSLAGSPYSDLLLPLQQTLATDMSAAAGWVAIEGGYPGLGLGPLLADHGGKFINRDDVSAILDSYELGGSSPLIQGYFEDTDTTKGDEVPATIWVMVTGWQGQVAFPTQEPPAGYVPAPGKPPPADVGAESSLWGFCCPGQWG